MICYKVLNNVHGVLRSSHATGKYLTIYKPNEIVYPQPNTYLFVFDDEQTARLFSEWCCELWECEADLADVPVFRGTPSYADDFWKIYHDEYVLEAGCYLYLKSKNGRIEVFNNDDIYSQHTRFAKSVKLLRRID